jgi:hypothetical protein
MNMEEPIVPDEETNKTTSMTKASWTSTSIAHLAVSQFVAVFLSDAERALRFEPERIIRTAYGRNQANLGPTVVELTLGPRASWAHLPALIECTTPPALDASESVIRVTWKSLYLARALPVMQADIALRPVPNGTEIVLSGLYKPPLGGFGVLFDRLIGRFVATATAKHFVASIAASLQSDVAHTGPVERTPLRLLNTSEQS